MTRSRMTRNKIDELPARVEHRNKVIDRSIVLSQTRRPLCALNSAIVLPVLTRPEIIDFGSLPVRPQPCRKCVKSPIWQMTKWTHSGRRFRRFLCAAITWLVCARPNWSSSNPVTSRKVWRWRVRRHSVGMVSFSLWIAIADYFMPTVFVKHAIITRHSVSIILGIRRPVDLTCRT